MKLEQRKLRRVGVEVQMDKPWRSGQDIKRTLAMVKGEFREKTWQAFYRTAVDGQTSQQVADELGMKAAAVRRAKSRVLTRLRDALSGLDRGGKPNNGMPPASAGGEQQ